MDSPTTTGEVNAHCLEHIMSLSETHEIVAAEDIVDNHGLKLWGKGQRVSRVLQEKLMRRRLERPLESSLTVNGGVTCDEIVSDCHDLIEGTPILHRLCATSVTKSLLNGFRDTPLPGSFRLLLTSARDGHLGSYQHGLHCISLAAAIAGRLALADREAQQLLMAALLHDIGELYVDPDYLRGGGRLSPAEWRHVAVHPRIGQMLVETLTTLSPTIALAVAEHHERLDGSGYPAQKAGTDISRLGRILAVSDTASAIFMNTPGGAEYRLAVATRIVPEEFDRSVVQALMQPLGTTDPIAGQACELAEALERIGKVALRLQGALKEAHSLIEREGHAAARDAGTYVLGALALLNKALLATGAVEATHIAELSDDPPLLAEVCQVGREVEWRMRNLARNVYLRTHLHAGGDGVNLVLDLVDALDGASSPRA